MKNLPEELLVNVLLWLPVKSLLRFKSVCKLWRSLISDPRFSNSHFQRSSLLPNRLLHIADSQVLSIDFISSFYDDSAVVRFNSPIIQPPRDLQIWGSCRGFMLLDDFHNFFVWNPSTGSFKRLPYSPMPSQFCPFIYGFGYDASNDDYLIVLAAEYLGHANYASDPQFFSMKANSWKKIDEGANFSYSNEIYEESRAESFLNGAIHWLVFHNDTSAEVILGFNVTTSNFIEIPLADDFEVLEFCYFGTLGGYLSLCEVGDDTANIWLMKEYGMRSSWTKSIVLSLANILTNDFCSIALTQRGEIVGTDGSSGLVKCNDKGEVVEYREYYDKRFEVVACTETLLSLP